jgi:nitrite reductase (NO-forming)
MMKRQSPQLVAIAGAMVLTIAGLMGLPSEASAKTHDVKMTALEVEIVTEGTGKKYKAWTFNGQMPGPAVRVTEGDTVNFTLENPKTNIFQHSMDFHAAEIDFLKNYRAIKPGETISYTFVAKKPKVWPKADREILLVQSELWNNPDDVEAMFGRKFDNVIFNGGIWKYHPFFIGGEALEAKPNERVRIYFVNAGPNEFSSLHPIGEIWDNVYESGNPANKLTGVQTYVVGPGSAATFDLVSESPGVYPIVTHSLTAALRGAIAALTITPVAKDAPLMPLTPWNP